MATMKEIAALSGVSVATVSHVLSGKKNVSEETRARVLRAVELTNYKLNTIAKSLRMNKTHIIGVLVEDICGLPVPEIVDGINEFLETSGYQVLLVSPDPVHFGRRDAHHPLALRAARLERKALLWRLREIGVQVIDWQVDQPLNKVTSRFQWELAR